MGMSVGVDLHKGQFTVYWRGSGAVGGRYGRYGTEESGYRRFETELRSLTEIGVPVKVAVESTGNAKYFRNRIQKLGVGVVVVNTNKFKVVAESVSKTDRRDAATLAEFLEKDMLPEARLCSQESEELRRLLKVRTNLVQTIVGIKNQLHGLLMSLGVESRRGQLQSAKERRRVQHELAAHNVTGAAVDPLFETIDLLSAQVKKLEKLIESRTADDEVVNLIKSIPGAGLITAATIRAWTDDIQRFSSPQKYAAFAGVVPRVQDSSDTVRHGRITGHGPVELRTALVQVVLGMVRLRRRTGKYRIMEHYARMKKLKGSGRSIVAVARRLSEIIWHMLNDGNEFDEARMLNPAIGKKAMEMQAAALDVA